MPDFRVKDYALYEKVANWDGIRKLDVDLSICEDWTEERILAFTDNDTAMLERFKRNGAICNLNAKERKAISEEGKPSKEELKRQALFEASKRVAIVKDNMYFSVNGKWVASIKERNRLAYQTLGKSTLFPEVADYILYADDSQKREFESFATRYIAVGSKFFDVKTGEMVDNAPEEFRTFGITKDIEYTPVKFEDCKSLLVTSIANAFGKDNLKYVLLNVAYNLTDNRTADRRALLLVGETRSGKGTLIKALKNVGLCADKDLSSEFSNNDDFFDMLSETIPVYPVVSADECENVNWTTVKKAASDDTMGVNRKGDKQVTVTVRAFIMMTANRVPRSSLTGLKNKIVVVKSEETYKTGIDLEYWDKVEKEGYDEFISLILTMAHKMTLQKWSPTIMPDSVKATNDELSSDFLYHDSFYQEWDKTVDENISIEDAYRAYLYYANPDIGSYEAINNAVGESQLTPASIPRGLAGVSRINFVGDARVNGIKNVVIHGKRYLRGKPPVRKEYKNEEKLEDYA